MPLSKDMWLGSHAWGRVAVLGGLAAVLAAVFLALPGGAGAVPLKKA
ncbi:MAG: hypothetical protein GY772_21295, partial [bacterium]|nr:hypothetical protein [bacterium]